MHGAYSCVAQTMFLGYVFSCSIVTIYDTRSVNYLQFISYRVTLLISTLVQAILRFKPHIL